MDCVYFNKHCECTQFRSLFIPQLSSFSTSPAHIIKYSTPIHKKTPYTRAVTPGPSPYFIPLFRSSRKDEIQPDNGP